MKLLRLLFQPHFRAPVLALLFASCVCVALLAARIVVDGTGRYVFLVWNLFLAWVPLVFALLLCEQHTLGRQKRWRLAGWGLTWLLFFPNAPYIFTDLTHLQIRLHSHYWTDMMLILSCAMTRMMVGFVSLYIVQSVVADRFGRLAGWLFITSVAGFTGIGVFVGRFLRYNTWDVLCHPIELCQLAGNWLADPFASGRPYIFSTMFAVFMFTAYLMFYMLTKLPPAEQITRGIEPR
jgi:uncharacterized membrane protein